MTHWRAALSWLWGYHVYLTEYLQKISDRITEWSVWQNFRLITSEVPTSGSIFGFAEYLSALALFLVVMTVSDFRFRYRLSLTRIDLRRVGFGLGFGVGAAVLAIDVWFQNGLPIPRVFANPNNLKAALALVFLIFVFHVISVAVIRPPTFTKANAKQFFEASYHFIHEGNPDRLQTIAEELRRPLESIITAAAEVPRVSDKVDNKTTWREADYAASFLLLIGDRRFCKIVVDKVPAFAFACFQSVQRHPLARLPIFQFARNIGQEFVRNTSSSFYQEDSGYHSGLVGYTQPATKIIFGSYEFVEKCAADGDSPLDTDYRDLDEFNETQMGGYSRASLAFLESYLKATKGQPSPHSYALARMLHSFESSLSEVYRINGLDDFSKASAYGRLRVTADFSKDAINLASKYMTRPRRIRSSEEMPKDFLDELAQLIFEMIFAASAVSSPDWTAWWIQHNTVWNTITGLGRNETQKIVAFKVNA